MRIEWSPPFTPHNLLQEQYWPDRWKVAVVCIFLNCTKRTVAEPIIHQFFELYPDPLEYACSYIDDTRKGFLLNLIAPLGFKNRRAERIFKFSIDFMAGREVSDSHGIGEYASACDRMYFDMEFDETPPKDGALVKVWEWVVKNKDCKVIS